MIKFIKKYTWKIRRFVVGLNSIQKFCLVFLLACGGYIFENKSLTYIHLSDARFVKFLVYFCLFGFFIFHSPKKDK